MNALKEIPSSLVVALDLETVRITDRFSDAPEDIQVAWAYKNKHDGKIQDIATQAELWEQKASLFPEFSKICSASLTFLNKDQTVLYCQNFTSANEYDLLIKLTDAINRMTKSDPRYRLLAHAGKMFDYPFMCKRLLINSLPIPAMLDSSGLKPWEIRNLDSIDLWKFGGITSTSLVAMCAALGVPISKGDMAGHEVGEYFYRGELVKIGDYCNKDTISLFNCFRRFKVEPIFRFEDVRILGDSPSTATSTVAVEDAEIVAKIPVMRCLNALYLTKEFSDDVKADIRARFLNPKKKVMQKDYKMLESMVCDLYIQTAMFKADKPAIMDAKRKEVKEFVAQLKLDKQNG